jgi:hypothetical protein
MIALAASAFPWPGQEIPSNKGHLPKACIQVLLLLANDLGFVATGAPMSGRVVGQSDCGGRPGWKTGRRCRIFAGMPVRVGMPMVEVTAPDGTKSVWAAAVAPSAAVEAVKKMIPPDHVATLSNRRLPIGPQSQGMRGGEVRKVES